jgi:hypothetical protein
MACNSLVGPGAAVNPACGALNVMFLGGLPNKRVQPRAVSASTRSLAASFEEQELEDWPDTKPAQADRVLRASLLTDMPIDGHANSLKCYGRICRNSWRS